MPSVPTHQNHGDVVGTAAIECRNDQLINAFLCAEIAPRQGAFDLTVIDLFGQAITAQQQLHARLQLAADRLHSQIFGVSDTERLGHHVAMRMAARLLRRDRTLFDQLLNIAVILRELLQPAVPEIGSAVADPGHFEALPVYADCGNGGAHRKGVAALAAVIDQLFVRTLYRSAQGCSRTHLAHDRIACHGAGHLAELMSAHAVSHQPESKLAVAVERVFVVLATQPDVTEKPKFDHACRPG